MNAPWCMKPMNVATFVTAFTAVLWFGLIKAESWDEPLGTDTTSPENQLLMDWIVSLGGQVDIGLSDVSFLVLLWYCTFYCYTSG